MIECLKQKFPESELKADDPIYHAGTYPYHNIWTDGIEDAKKMDEDPLAGQKIWGISCIWDKEALGYLELIRQRDINLERAIAFKYKEKNAKDETWVTIPSIEEPINYMPPMPLEMFACIISSFEYF